MADSRLQHSIWQQAGTASLYAQTTNAVVPSFVQDRLSRPLQQQLFNPHPTQHNLYESQFHYCAPPPLTPPPSATYFNPQTQAQPQDPSSSRSHVRQYSAPSAMPTTNQVAGWPPPTQAQRAVMEGSSVIAPDAHLRRQTVSGGAFTSVPTPMHPALEWTPFSVPHRTIIADSRSAPHTPVPSGPHAPPAPRALVAAAESPAAMSPPEGLFGPLRNHVHEIMDKVLDATQYKVVQEVEAVIALAQRNEAELKQHYETQLRAEREQREKALQEEREESERALRDAREQSERASREAREQSELAVAAARAERDRALDERERAVAAAREERERALQRAREACVAALRTGRSEGEGALRSQMAELETQVGRADAEMARLSADNERMREQADSLLKVQLVELRAQVEKAEGETARVTAENAKQKQVLTKLYSTNLQSREAAANIMEERLTLREENWKLTQEVARLAARAEGKADMDEEQEGSELIAPRLLQKVQLEIHRRNTIAKERALLEHVYKQVSPLDGTLRPPSSVSSVYLPSDDAVSQVLASSSSTNLSDLARASASFIERRPQLDLREPLSRAAQDSMDEGAPPTPPCEPAQVPLAMRPETPLDLQASQSATRESPKVEVDTPPTPRSSSPEPVRSTLAPPLPPLTLPAISNVSPVPEPVTPLSPIRRTVLSVAMQTLNGLESKTERQKSSGAPSNLATSARAPSSNVPASPFPSATSRIASRNDAVKDAAPAHSSTSPLSELSAVKLEPAGDRRALFLPSATPSPRSSLAVPRPASSASTARSTVSIKEELLYPSDTSPPADMASGDVKMDVDESSHAESSQDLPDCSFGSPKLLRMPASQDSAAEHAPQHGAELEGVPSPPPAQPSSAKKRIRVVAAPGDPVAVAEPKDEPAAKIRRVSDQHDVSTVREAAAIEHAGSQKSSDKPPTQTSPRSPEESLTAKIVRKQAERAKLKAAVTTKKQSALSPSSPIDRARSGESPGIPSTRTDPSRAPAAPSSAAPAGSSQIAPTAKPKSTENRATKLQGLVEHMKADTAPMPKPRVDRNRPSAVAQTAKLNPEKQPAKGAGTARRVPSSGNAISRRQPSSAGDGPSRSANAVRASASTKPPEERLSDPRLKRTASSGKLASLAASPGSSSISPQHTSGRSTITGRSTSPARSQSSLKDPQAPSPTMSTGAPPPNQQRTSLEPKCLPLLYQECDEFYYCELCLLRQEMVESHPVQSFPVEGTSWDMLQSHCSQSHRGAYETLLGKSKAEIDETLLEKRKAEIDETL